jgi:indolepyruvate ferredoxin oxidoreductase
VIAIAGDDHISKSSTAAHQSDHIFKACGTPVFFPAMCRTSWTWACTPLP